MRGDARNLGDDRQVHVGDFEPLLSGEEQCFADEYPRGHVVEIGIAVRKKLADVPTGHAAENGVGERMQQHVAVGMGQHLGRAEDRVAAEL